MQETTRLSLVLGRGAATPVDPAVAEYAERDAPPHLRQQVLALWRARAVASDDWHHLVFPDGFCDVVVTNDLRVLAIGPSSHTSRQRIAAGHTVWGARLWPGALRRLTGAPASELRDRAVPIAVLEPDVDTAASTLDAFLRFLGPLAGPRSESQERAVRACASVGTAGRMPAISSVAAELGISERSVRSLFAECVGLAPSTYHQVRRLQHTLARSVRSRLPLADLAHDCGYADQAHLCRQMRSLTGLTPTMTRSWTAAGSFKTTS